MCVVSMVGDHYRDSWPKRFPTWIPPVGGEWPPATLPPNPGVNREEFEALKRDVEEMRSLLRRAKEYDERNNEPACETDEKMDFLRRAAALVGINLDDVIGKKESA